MIWSGWEHARPEFHQQVRIQGKENKLFDALDDNTPTS